MAGMKIFKQHSLKSTAGIMFAVLMVGTCDGLAADSLPACRMEIPLPLQPISVSIDSNGVAVFKGSELTGATGQPALPAVTVKVLLPPDADLRSVRAALTNENHTNIDGQFDVAPIPPAISRVKEFWPERVQFAGGRDVASYSDDAYFPTSFLGLVLPVQMREWRMVEVEIRLFKYNPVRKRLMGLITGNLVLTFERIPGMEVMSTRSPTMAVKFREKVRSQVVNFEVAVRDYEAASK
jgi:hypothetical protein